MRNTIDISIAKAQDARSELAEARLRAIVIRDRVLTFYEHHVGSELLEEFQRLFRLGKVVSVKPLRVAIASQSKRLEYSHPAICALCP